MNFFFLKNPLINYIESWMLFYSLRTTSLLSVLKERIRRQTGLGRHLASIFALNGRTNLKEGWKKRVCQCIIASRLTSDHFLAYYQITYIMSVWSASSSKRLIWFRVRPVLLLCCQPKAAFKFENTALSCLSCNNKRWIYETRNTKARDSKWSQTDCRFLFFRADNCVN